jgi:hypothetical protein
MPDNNSYPDFESPHEGIKQVRRNVVHNYLLIIETHAVLGLCLLNSLAHGTSQKRTSRCAGGWLWR